MNYQEQLKTKEWDKKRLHIVNRDNYTCYLCGYHGLRLNVHHIEYIPNRMAWEYPDESLFTVCYGCHKVIHMPDLILKKVNNTIIGNLIKKHGFKRSK